MNQVSLGTERAAFAGRTSARVRDADKEIKETSRLRLGSCSCGICERNGVGWRLPRASRYLLKVDLNGGCCTKTCEVKIVICIDQKWFVVVVFIWFNLIPTR